MSRLFVELAIVAGLVSAAAWADHVCSRGLPLAPPLVSTPAKPERAMGVTVIDMTTGRIRTCQQMGGMIACH